MLLPRPSSSPSARPTRRARQGHEGRRRGLPDVPSECAPQVLSTLSLPPALQLDTAELVYNDCLACAWRAEHAALPAPTARRGGLSNRAQLPDAEALAVLVQVRRARHTIAAIEGGGGGEGAAWLSYRLVAAPTGAQMHGCLGPPAGQPRTVRPPARPVVLELVLELIGVWFVPPRRPLPPPPTCAARPSTTSSCGAAGAAAWPPSPSPTAACGSC